MSDHPTHLLSLSALLTERDALLDLEQRLDRELEKRISKPDAEVGQTGNTFGMTDEIRRRPARRHG